MEEQLTTLVKRDLERGVVPGYIEPPLVAIHLQRYDRNLAAQVQQFSAHIGSALCINVCLITTELGRKNEYNLFLRVPIAGWKVLNGRITTSWQTWPSLSICPYLRVQNVISEDSPILEACQRGDTALMESLFSTGRAHPNDTTVDNHTLLYVCLFKFELL